MLRAVEERKISKVGSHRVITVDVRIIAATNKDLTKAIKDGSFREDLFYRLNVVLIQMPPLRERKNDIPLLAQHFLEKYNARLRKNLQGIRGDAPYVFPQTAVVLLEKVLDQQGDVAFPLA